MLHNKQIVNNHKLNNKAVIDEQLRMNDPHYERRQAREEFFEAKQKMLENFKGKEHMQESAISLIKKRKRDDTKETFGWQVFNADSIYKAYEKRVNKIPKLMEGQSITTKQQREDMMANEVVATMEKRNQYSRKRLDDDAKDITSINKRNEIFNKKLDRNYSKFANEIRGNLERGTAL